MDLILLNGGKKMKTKVKIFSSTNNIGLLQSNINAFLEKIPEDLLIDVKFESNNFGLFGIIVYKEVTDEK